MNIKILNPNKKHKLTEEELDLIQKDKEKGIRNRKLKNLRRKAKKINKIEKKRRIQAKIIKPISKGYK